MMTRSFWTCGTLLATALVLGLTAGRSSADTVHVGDPPANCAAPLAVAYYAAPTPAPAVSNYAEAAPTAAVSYYAAPAVSYYAAPVVSYYAAPATSYYAAASTPVAVTTVRPGILRRREIVTTRYYATTPAPAVAYAPAPVVAAPAVSAYYNPVYLYP